MNTLSKISSSRSNAPPPKSNDPASPALNPTTKHHSSNVPPTLSTAALAVPGNADNQNLGLSEQQLKRQGLESLVAVLRSLVTWGTASGKTVNGSDATQDAPVSSSSTRGSNADGMVSDSSLDKLPAPANGADVSRVATPEIADDPGKFESAKQRKTILQEGIKRFNYKPKKGVEFLLQHGFIASREPAEIAKFLLRTDGLNKTVIGDYLGEGYVFINFFGGAGSENIPEVMKRTSPSCMHSWMNWTSPDYHSWMPSENSFRLSGYRERRKRLTDTC